MAKRRMISMDVFGRGAFMELPPEAIALYTYLTLYADDDGFHGAPKQAARMLGYGADALQALEAAGFVICFAGGPAVITHFKLTNRIPKDRYTPTIYQKEYALLEHSPTEGYRLRETGDGGASQNETGDGGVSRNPETDHGTSGLPLADGSTYCPDAAALAEYASLYPDTDVAQELRSMRGWLLSHPEKQKDAGNAQRFVHFWLRDAQKRAKQPQCAPAGPPYGSADSGSRRRSLELPPSYDMDKAEQKLFTTVPKLKKRTPPRAESS